MPRSNSKNNALTYTAAAVAVIAVAFSVGYFVIGGSRPPAPTDNAIPQNTIPAAAPEPAKPPAKRIAATVRTQNGEYSAPGAPRIQIKEDKNPSLIDTSKIRVKSSDDADADSEATQEAPTPKPAADTTSLDGGTSVSTDSTSTRIDSTNPTGAANSGSASTSSDPDTEQVGGQAAPDNGTSSHAQFRVQAGSFVAAANAKALADALKNRGYPTSTHAERDGGKTVYKVQVGAYRTRSAADKAAQELQSSGYPASVSPISP